MSVVTANIAQLLSRELDGFKRELALFPDDETMWTTVPGVTNSAGNLALHVAGGLQYLVGAVLGDTGYVRNREAEFGRRSGTRAELMGELDKAAVVVRDVLPRLPESTLAAELPEPVMGMRFRTDLFLLHLCAHAGFHLGQAGYIRRIVTGDATSSGPLPLQPLAL
jgi:hypothetical protein